MITTKEIFASNIKKIRKNMGLTQEKFAEKIGIQARNLTDLENAKYLPTPLNIDKICKNLNVPVSFLFKLPEELVDESKFEKIKQIEEILYTLNDEKVMIIYNIITNAFKNID